MKKFFALFLLLAVYLSASAQKSYITMISYDLYENHQRIKLTGDLPSDMKTYYKDKTSGEILNLLSQHGYEVEQMTGTATSSVCHVAYLLSKGTSSSSYSAIRKTVNDDEEVTEVARYNLQGMPISENEKGIQIVVFSNYTTKTIIVE